ncbi:RusA family crossover junction endodeoxyribonuclease [Alkalicoccobacillus gibsonii]|uniref:RusA family crossover junction endodeoxyribonuclease n=1 Tax=Alkalicoccobacillus gibsonii TaxID=79881 RepID=UPI003F7C56F8
MKTEFFMPMKPPTMTHQQKQVTVRNGKPVFYEPDELKAVRTKLMTHIGKHIPPDCYKTAIRLTTWWCYPVTGKHTDGEYKTTKPDTDNMIKMLKDCMTASKFWTDDSLVASEVTEKYWANVPGIYVKIEEI